MVTTYRCSGATYRVSSSRVKLKMVDSSWNMMAHGDSGEGKWRGNWRMYWVASTLHTTSEHGVSSITTADGHTSAASSRLNWRPPADLNGLVRFAKRQNLVSALCHYISTCPYVKKPVGFKRLTTYGDTQTPVHVPSDSWRRAQRTLILLSFVLTRTTTALDRLLRRQSNGPRAHKQVLFCRKR